MILAWNLAVESRDFFFAKMDGRKREGLCVRIGLKTTAPPTPRISNAERCRAYRMSIKADPEQHALNRLKEAERIGSLPQKNRSKEPGI